MTADRHVYMPDTRTNSHVHTLTHQTVTEAVCTDTHMSTHTDTCACTQIHTSTVCRHTCRVKNTYTDTHTCMQQTHTGACVHMHERHGHTYSQIHEYTDTHRYAYIQPTHADTHRASCTQALNTHVCAHRHAETHVRACTRQTHIYHRCTNTAYARCADTHRPLQTHVHTDTPCAVLTWAHSCGHQPTPACTLPCGSQASLPGRPHPLPFISLRTVASKLD